MIKPKVGKVKGEEEKGVTSTASPMVPRVAQAVPPIPPAHMKIATALLVFNLTHLHKSK